MDKTDKTDKKDKADKTKTDTTDHDEIIELKVEVEYLKQQIEKLSNDAKDLRESTTKRLDDFFDVFKDINPKLSTQEKSAIIVAIITAIASISIALFNKII